MSIPVELTNTPKSVRARIRSLLLSSPATIVSSTPPVLALDEPATLWLNSDTGDVVLIYGGVHYDLGTDSAIVKASVPPDNGDALWIDLVDGTANYHDGSVWVTLSANVAVSNGLPRETRVITPVDQQVITIDANKDTTLHLSPAVDMEVDFEFPVGADGQMVLIVMPSYGNVAITATLLWASGGFSTTLFSATTNYAFQYVAAQQIWKAL